MRDSIYIEHNIKECAVNIGKTPYTVTLKQPTNFN